MGEKEPRTLGRYHLLAKLATGGMAEIHLARQTGIQGFERLVVLKQILPNLASEPHFLEMFLDEARITVQLNHPNIIQTYDLGEEGGVYYMALEYLEGESLAYLTREASRQHHRLAPHLAAAIVAAVADGLAYAHAFATPDGKPLGIVHRDVSPQNIIVLFNGGVKLVDFGVAKAASRMSQTRAGVLKGKISYMSPEQCSGGAVDRRSDIFSLGVVLWGLLTGQRLFRRDNEAATIKAIVFEPLPDLAAQAQGFPPELVAITLRALERDPARRFQDCAALSAALRDWLRRSQAAAGPAEIAAFLETLCGERIRTKKQLLEKVQQGPGAELALDILRPNTGESMASSSLPGRADTRARPGREGGAAPRWRGSVVLLVGLTVALLAGAALAWLLPRASEPPAPPLDHGAGSPDAGVLAPAPDAGALPEAPPDGDGDAALAAALRPARLDVVSTPEGCAVEVDGQPAQGATPLRGLDLEPSREHSVVVRCAGHREERKTLVAGEGQRAELRFAPPMDQVRPKAPGTLRLNTVPWTEVYLGKRKLGVTPLLDLPMPAGRYKLDLVNPETGLQRSLWVTIKPGKATVLSQKL
jgi:eukaryotic-like serine/threonine-protein kinase